MTTQFVFDSDLGADVDQQALHGADVAHARDAAQTTSPSVRSAAASAGRAEFFEPLVGMAPSSRVAAFDDKFIH